MSVLKYKFSKEWTPVIENGVKEIISQIWMDVEEEELDPEILEYLMALVKNGSSMEEIMKNLNETSDEIKFREIALRLGENLKAYENKDTLPKQKIVSIVSSNDVPLNSLKSSRNEQSTKINQESKVEKLLNSSLKSSRDSKSDNFGNDRSKNRNKRQIDNKFANFSSNNAQSQINQVYSNQPSKKSRPSNLQHPNLIQPGGDPTQTVEYFEKLNQVAIASGFRNAQEMFESQKQLLNIMSNPSPRPPSYPPPVDQMQGMNNNQYFQSKPPLPPTPNPVTAISSSNPHGQNDFSSYPQVDQNLQTNYYYNNSRPNNFFRGRGRGRGGIHIPVTSLPTANSNEFSNTDPTLVSDNPLNPNALPFQPTSFRGRGGRSGRSFRGRGGRVSTNKTWVRSPDLETPLTSKR